MNRELLAKIPKIDVLLQDSRITGAEMTWGRAYVVDVLRAAVDRCRGDILSGRENAAPDSESIIEDALDRLEREPRYSLRPVINGTGIVLHTNLGRAPLSKRAIQAVADTAGCYTNLEYDLDAGRRGSRYDHVAGILRELCGTEDAMVVNNNAAAVLLTLAALAPGKEVIVSRGELVEIGGSFRIPDVCLQSGAVLREVGTTNRTRAEDYRAAVSEDTGAVLKVHTSNYRIVGFTEDTSIEELAVLAGEYHLPLIYDMGSGLFEGLGQYGIDEPDIHHVLKSGVDILTFSGDKLLGGAQAGLIVGRREYIERMKHHPLARALRVDKMTIAALEATLCEYRDRGQARREIPVLRMIFENADSLRVRAERLCRMLREILPGSADFQFEVEACEDKTGGGSAPLSSLKGYAVTVKAAGRELLEIEDSLRKARYPLVARVSEDRLWICVRTLLEGDEEKICEDFRELMG